MLHITPDDSRAEHARELLRALKVELAERYGEHVAFRRKGRDGEDPFAMFVVAWFGEQAVGCGALQALGPGLAQIKHLYVRPSHRNRGIGRELLATLERHARRLGYRTLRLATGNLQPEAVAFYKSAGYQPIPPFGKYRRRKRSLCFEKTLPESE